MNEPVDTTNYFAVGVRGDGIVILKWGRLLTVPQALNLAAWLVANVEAIAVSADEFSGQTDFDTYLQAVRNS